MPRITCLNGHEIELQPAQFGQRIACPLCQLMMVVSPPRAGEQLLPKYEVLCEQGHVLRVKSRYLGTQIRCPQCQGLAWVTMDRLQKHSSAAIVEPVIPRRGEQPDLPARIIPQPASSPIISADSLANIPLAEVDVEYNKALRMRSSDEVEDDHTYDDDSKTLTKADRRNIKLVIQGLGYWLGGVIGYCSIFLLTTILSFLFSVISQGISTFEGHRTVNSIFEVFGWIIVIATLLNTLLYLGGKILILFTPWKTGATLWFILSLVFTVALIGFRIFLIAREGAWGRSLMTYLFGLTIAGKLYFCINEVLFICMWLLMIVGLWRLMKFSRKPNIRMRVILMGMLGTGFWVVLVIIPLLSEYFPVSSQIALWVVVTLKLLLTLAMGGFMLFQHYTIVNEVCSELARAK